MDFTQLARQNPWWAEKQAIDGDVDIAKWREKRFKWVPGFVGEFSLGWMGLHVLLGPRQTGKTTSVKLLIKRFLGECDAKSIFYFNCEFVGDFKELIEVVEAYLDFRENSGLAKSLIVLDEVSSPSEWFRGIKFLIDSGRLKNDVLLVTGSSSISVKRKVELFPGRRGKGKDFFLFPLSFRGFLKAANPEFVQKIPVARDLSELQAKALAALPHLDYLNKQLSVYMKYGGFPLSVEAIGGGNEEAKLACLNWIKTAVLKADKSDLVARQILGDFMEKMPSAISWEGVSKDIEVKSPKTVSSYADLLSSLFVLLVSYSIDVNDKKIKFAKNKKIHFCDPLLLDVVEDWSLTSVKNKENVVAESLASTHLSRLCPERVFFWKNGFEIDAIVLDKAGLHGFEVKWSEKPRGKALPQLKSFTILTKNFFSPKPASIPLAVFLSILDV